MCEDTRDCVCANAMKNVYLELRQKNLPERWGIEAATHVFRFHHPDKSRIEAKREAISLAHEIKAGFLS